MANVCMYHMEVTGTEENVKRFAGILENNTLDGQRRRFARIYDAVTDKIEDAENGNKKLIITGSCAWSIHTACIDYKKPVDAELITLEEATRLCNVSVKVYSSEPGIGFQERILVSCGRTVSDDEVDYSEAWWDKENETFEEFKLINNLPDSITEADLDGGDTISIGGFAESPLN